MEVDQADSPGDSPTDPEISRFVDNMGLRFENCEILHRQSGAGFSLPTLHIAEAQRVSGPHAPAGLNLLQAKRLEYSATLAGTLFGTQFFDMGVRQRVRCQTQQTWALTKLQPLQREPNCEAKPSYKGHSLTNPRVRIPV